MLMWELPLKSVTFINNPVSCHQPDYVGTIDVPTPPLETLRMLEILIFDINTHVQHLQRSHGCFKRGPQRKLRNSFRKSDNPPSARHLQQPPGQGQGKTQPGLSGL